jgi:hypothetical protein
MEGQQKLQLEMKKMARYQEEVRKSNSTSQVVSSRLVRQVELSEELESPVLGEHKRRCRLLKKVHTRKAPIVLANNGNAEGSTGFLECHFSNFTTHWTAMKTGNYATSNWHFR